jgi:type II secretory pathway pseudopilin PulG
MLIISILIGMIFPAMVAVRRMAMRKQAESEAKAFVHAVKGYRTDYGHWPGQTQGGEDLTYPDEVNQSVILDALFNNPRQKNYLEVAPLSINGDGCYTDPWNRVYVVAMDENNDGTVDVDTTYNGHTIQTNIRDTAVVLSWGRDPANVKRRVYSWGD